jgi:RNA:NAD 2'-phosphotransferase (TPT1/KptA family)/8-oxo-dGTP pyrophosphatase MutT (NUDIX family)
MSNNISKSMSYLLRHGLEKENINNNNGFVKIDDLIDWLKTRNIITTKDDIMKIAKDDNKQRYKIIENNIRANQGHSVNVQIDFDVLNSIDDMYPLIHATYKDSIKPIVENGLKPMERTHIHFTSIKNNNFKAIRQDTDTYCILKKKYDKCIYKSENDVYLSKDIIDKKDFDIITFTRKINCYGGIIFDEEFKKVIIVKTDKNNIGFPKGKRNKNELPFEAALREVKEETSLEIENINFIENIVSINEKSSRSDIFSIGYFIGWTSQKYIKQTNPEELENVEWIEIEKVKEILPEKRKIIFDEVLNIINNNKIISD